MRRLCTLLVLATGGLTPPRSPHVPAAGPPPDTPARHLLAGADGRRAAALHKQLMASLDAGRYDEALSPAAELYALRARVQGARHWETAEAPENLRFVRKAAALSPTARTRFHAALLLQSQVGARMSTGRYAEAEPLARKALASWLASFGEDYAVTGSSYNTLGLALVGQGKHAEAIPYFERAIALRTRLMGERHPLAAIVLTNLASALGALGRHAEARALYVKSLALYRKAFGEDHARTANAYARLADLLRVQGKLDEALSLSEKALAIRRKVLGELHPETAFSYHNLGVLLQEMGRHARARALLERNLVIMRAALGESHPHVAVAYDSLGANLQAEGRYAEAQPFLERALTLRKKALGENALPTATSYNNLAACLSLRGQLAPAQRLYEKALALNARVLGEDHPATATSRDNLSANLQAQGKYALAQALCERALAARKKALGERHLDTATSYSNLAANLYRQGKYEPARSNAEKALKLFRDLAGDHPATAVNYTLLARILHVQGRYKAAERTARRGARSHGAARLHVGSTGLQRAGFFAVVSPLPLLTALEARNGEAREAFASLEQSLARGLLDDLAARSRLLTAGERRRREELRARVGLLERQLTALGEGEGKAAREEADRLREKRDAARADLSALEVALAKKYGPAAGQVYDLARIREHLPADAALVAWVDLGDQPGAADPRGEHWACVVRRAGEPAWVRLEGSGPKGAWTDADAELPVRLRAALARPTGDDWRARARSLYAQRVAPLLGRLRGVKRLVVLPSPALAGVPVEAILAARPKGAPGFTVSYAPSGTLFAWLRERPALAGKERRLLALGDPVFAPREAPPEPPDHGALLAGVLPGGSAAKAGLRAGDVLLRYAGTKLKGPQDLRPSASRGRAPGS
jgi:tetratricopeptide (TPR) repeat protein